MPGLFDHYVIVDWSAAARPKTGRDSIWICHRGPHGERCDNPPTRHLAKRHLADILAAATGRGERVLLGFDFPFGYPEGFAARLGLTGTPWRALWDEIASLLNDNEDNSNDRFELGAAFNRRASKAGFPFPFWGCPVRFRHDFLGPKHHGRHTIEGLAERRLIDEWMVGAQPCWKLAYTGSVGSQTLTGIPVVRELRDDPRWADRAGIWPFETGLGLKDGTSIVFAEVWPSWWRKQIRTELGPPNDRAQVRSVAEIFAATDRTGELAAWFAGAANLTVQQRKIIESEEAWTLGVTAPRHKRSPSNTGVARLLRSARNDTAVSVKESCHCEARSNEAISIRASAVHSQDAKYTYIRDPAAIYRRSFALVREEADLGRFPPALRALAIRLAHAAGDVSILDDLAWSPGAVAAGRRALASGAAILVDSTMVGSGIAPERLHAGNAVICTLRDPTIPALAASHKTTRSAAAVELWRPYLAGSVVAIGNAPTALFHLLELVAAGADRPALVLGFPVGFVGAAEAKEALIGFGGGLRYVTLKGRRGGSALAAAAVNALGGGKPRSSTFPQAREG
jgi:precorrin-8X/cobalt-precorrin-8 methylmutase